MAYVAEQVGVDAALFGKYEFSSRAAKYHRTQIRDELGFRECSEADQTELTALAVGRAVPDRVTSRAVARGGGWLRVAP